MTAFLFPPSDLRLCWAGAWVERESLLTRALRVFRRPRRHEKRPVQLAFVWEVAAKVKVKKAKKAKGAKKAVKYSGAAEWDQFMRQIGIWDDAEAVRQITDPGPLYFTIKRFVEDGKRHLNKFIPEAILGGLKLQLEVQEAADQGKRGGRPRGKR
jgi:hypothetical protein